MMKMDTLYNYLQGIQSLLAPAMVAVFAMGIFFKKITPKAGEYTMITGFLIGMLRLVTNVITDTGKATMDGAFWDYTAWFWQTNWLVFECWLLVFLIIFIYLGGRRNVGYVGTCQFGNGARFFPVGHTQYI